LPKVTAKFQVTIPLDVRRDLNIVPGTEVDIAREGQRYVLIVDPIQTIKEKWRGKFKGGTTTMEYLDDVRGTID
jgi:AbrB family looped-hinge helix DNA binding protein